MNEIDTYLAHHGIKGQKWGVRRYQNADGTLTAEGRKRAGLGPEKKESSVKKMVKEARERSAKKKAAAAAEEHENLKKYVRNHPAKAYKFREEFSDSEVNELISRINADRRLKDLRDSEIQRGWDKINKFATNMGTLANLTNNSINTWNNTARIYNALADNGVFTTDKRMPGVK